MTNPTGLTVKGADCAQAAQDRKPTQGSISRYTLVFLAGKCQKGALSVDCIQGGAGTPVQTLIPSVISFGTGSLSFHGGNGLPNFSCLLNDFRVTSLERRMLTVVLGSY